VRMSCESCSSAGSIDRVNTNQGTERDLVVNFLTRQCGFDQLYFSLRSIKQAGVGMFMRKMPKPERVQFKIPGTEVGGDGFHHPEGRIVLADFESENLQLLLTYVPNNGWAEDSFAKRRRFDHEMKNFLEAAKCQGRRTIWLGDLVRGEDASSLSLARPVCGENVAANWNDVGPDPAWFRRQKQSPGFAELLKTGGLIDAYRHCHPDEDWEKDATWRGAPGKPPNPPEFGRFYGKGMRIDYVLVPESMTKDVKSVENLGIGKERKGFMGSDHAPLLAMINIRQPETSPGSLERASDTGHGEAAEAEPDGRPEPSAGVVELDD
ncbi:hypothetical protein FOZ63_001688, partial [Perkinsus olseni]